MNYKQAKHTVLKSAARRGLSVKARYSAKDKQRWIVESLQRLMGVASRLIRAADDPHTDYDEKLLWVIQDEIASISQYDTEGLLKGEAAQLARLLKALQSTERTFAYNDDVQNEKVERKIGLIAEQMMKVLIVARRKARSRFGRG